MARRKRTFSGQYRGTAVETRDPERRGRLLVVIPADEQRSLGAAVRPVCRAVPLPGDNVWVEFDGGDPRQPVWAGF
jgi:hypothetical protein